MSTTGSITPRDNIDRPTGARNKKKKRTNWQANMAKKYIVASRQMVSKRVGIPGYLSHGFAAMRTTKIAKTSIRALELVPCRKLEDTWANRKRPQWRRN